MTSLNVHIQPCGDQPQDRICGDYGVCLRSHKVNADVTDAVMLLRKGLGQRLVIEMLPHLKICT